MLRRQFRKFLFGFVKFWQNTFVLILLLEDDITNAGAIYTDKPAVVDGKIVTTAHYKDMGPWMKAALNFFNEKK